MVAITEDQESATPTNWQRLPTDTFTYQLRVRIICLGIALDGVSLVIDGFPCALNPLQFLAKFLSTYTSIRLRHTGAIMAEQTTDDFKRNIIIDEAHPQGMPKLMGLKSPNRSIPIPNILVNRPFVNDSGKITLLKGLS